MKFTDFHKAFFMSPEGSFSRVTYRENFDSQITLTDVEYELVVAYYNLNEIHVGNVTSDREKSKKEFLLYPHFNTIELNLVFPKPDKAELRLYLSQRAGFKPLSGDIWFMYINQNKKLVIGSMPPNEWDRIGQSDEVDEIYQKSLEEVISSGLVTEDYPEGRIVDLKLPERRIYGRDPRMALRRFQISDYKCEINDKHATFTSMATNMPYMEAHHLIPMKYQEFFAEPLDVVQNIVCLCPTCHRGFHLATVDHKLELIKSVYVKRVELHRFSIDDIAQYYNCIKPS